MRSGLVLAILVLGMAGCSSWHEVSPGPSAVVKTTHDALKVHTKDRGPIVLSDATIAGDSLVGRFETSERPPVPPVLRGTRYPIAVTDIERVEVRRSDPAATVVVVLLLALAAAMLIVSDFNPVY